MPLACSLLPARHFHACCCCCAVPSSSGVFAFLMLRAWMSGMSGASAAFTSLWRSSSRLPWKAGLTTYTSKLVPQLRLSGREGKIGRERPAVVAVVSSEE